ncbi:uncharacterized protein PG998_012805 [Apiospora kogelbergensis]|uniref:Uncharacterized protein n=1 Tax=Apiospora kogelbergensis TaxID=1337665 RepID=A0AAW0QIW4_9PEZI
MPLIQHGQRWRPRPAVIWVGLAGSAVTIVTLLLYLVVRVFVRERERYIPPAYLGRVEEGGTLGSKN